MMKTYIWIVGLLALSSCTKDFLSVKSDKKLVIPSTLQDFRALMDRAETMNEALPYLGHLAADDYYLTPQVYAGLTDLIKRNSYSWNKEIYEGSLDIAWSNSYQQIFYANNVLEGLELLNSKEAEVQFLKGTALFFRSFAYYNLSQIYCDTYQTKGDNKGPGLPLRVQSDINDKVGRSTVAQTYDQMEADLKAAIALLPLNTTVKTRPNKLAAQALLARLYLVMGNYAESLRLCESILPHVKLLDYTMIKTAVDFSMTQFNEEVLFHSVMAYVSFKNSSDYVDSTIMKAYAGDDLRLQAYFTYREGKAVFIGNYSGEPALFNGLAVDEVYLTAMECLARLNRLDEAKTYYRQFMATRLRDHRQVEISPDMKQAGLLALILLERRKSLLYRGLRFTDIRRLNKNEDAGIVLTRDLGDRKVELRPNSPNYILPIPDLVISLSGIEQNSRE